MQITEGTNVYTEDGKEVGTVDRVVLDPHTLKVTHLVVREGVIFSEDKVVPIDFIDFATEDQVMLRNDAPDPSELLPFEESHYTPITQQEESRMQEPLPQTPAMYWYPPVGAATWGRPYLPYLDPPFVVETIQNIPEGTIPLKEGADVSTADGEDVGEIERVFTDPESDRVTHFLISEGLFFKEKKLVPATWIDRVEENKVSLVVSSNLLDRLPKYEE